jgi:PhzF family phenazine biosynthesis protein
MNLNIYQIDAFADKPFSGNPAAVVPLEKWMDDNCLQKIGNENNLAETAFIVPKGKNYEIRWFTPTIEVDLCGHATLAAAYVIFNILEFGRKKVTFHTRKSGDLTVTKLNDLIELDFPTDIINPEDALVPVDLLLGIGKQPLIAFKGKTDYLLIFEKQSDIESITPDFNRLARVKGRGVIVSAPGDDVDFVSRFFAPQSGVNEDPVTGSAHTTLVPYWYGQTGKTALLAKQLSVRGGTLFCEYHGNRVKIAGKAWLYLQGQINSCLF